MTINDRRENEIFKLYTVMFMLYSTIEICIYTKATECGTVFHLPPYLLIGCASPPDRNST